MKANYHTHTTRCQHAEGEDEAYVLAAMEAGFDTLGFADHAPWPFANNFVSTIRMSLSELQDYIDSIHRLQAKYAEQLPIRLGLESEYFPRYHDHLLRMRDMGINYYILGQHYADSEEDTPYTGWDCQTDEGVKRYMDATCRAIATGLFSYVAHPDLFMRHRREEEFNAVCEQASDAICQAAKEADMPIEYNLLGLSALREGHPRGYPSQRFWEYIKPHHNTVILGVDAHAPAHLLDDDLWVDGRRRVTDLGFTLTDTIRIQED